MKKLASFFLAACFIFSIKMFAQTAAKAEWFLDDSTGATITGNLVADTMQLAGTLTIKDFTGSSAFGPAVRINAGTVGFAAGEPGPDYTRYVQCLVKPSAGNNFHVDSIAFWMACYGTHGYMHGAVYWDTDTANFSQNNLVDYDSVTYPTATSTVIGLPDIREDQPSSGLPHDTSYTINTNINNGGLFALRFYPWYNYSSASTSKYLVLYDVRVYGTTSPATAVENEKSVPKVFSLSQNYPNPFNPVTTITYSLPERQNIRIKIYDLLGLEVATIVEGVRNAGTHTVRFNASNLPTGMYFYRFETETGYTTVRRMLLIK